MTVQWDPKIGLAAVSAIGGSLMVFATVLLAWGALTAKVDSAAEKAVEAKAAIALATKQSEKRDEVINQHSVSLSQIQTQIGYINPTLQRIEAKLDARK
jgi:hypothetical protein